VSGTSDGLLPTGDVGGLAAPALGPDGTIYLYVGSFDSRHAELVAVTHDGAERWRRQIGDASPGDLVVSGDGKVYVKVEHGVVAVRDDGVELWRFNPANDAVEDGGISLASDGTLYFACRFLYALGDQGATKWVFKAERTYAIPGDYFVGTPIVASDGTVYLMTYWQQLYAITADGRKKWTLVGDPAGGSAKHFGRITLTADGRLRTEVGWMRVPSGLATAGWPSEDRDASHRRSQEIAR
jgi:outer membrane protein assembly factor BamB